MPPKTIFKDVNNWGNLINNPKMLLRLNAEFKDLGFKQIRMQEKINATTFCKSLTLFIQPQFREDFKAKNVDTRSNEDLNFFIGSKKGFVGDFFYQVPIMDKTKTFSIYFTRRLRAQKFEMGCYIKNRNIVMLYFPIIDKTRLDYHEKNELLFFFLKEFKKWMSNIRVQKIDVKEKIMDMMIVKFFSETENKVIQSKNSIIESESQIRYLREEVVKYYVRIDQSKEQLIFLEHLSKNKVVAFRKKLDEITKLEFVKNIELTDSGIVVDVGDVAMMRGRRKYKLGNYQIIIKPNSIEVKNDKPVKRGDDSYHHPHVSQDNICFGSGKDKAYELLGTMQLKKLVYYMYVFLKSYNSKDPYIKLTEFIGLQNEQYEEKQEVSEQDKKLDFAEDDDDEDGDEEDLRFQ